MGGFFGAVCKHDAVADIFFGVDYHSHLGTRRGGVAAYNKEIGLQREIHSIENSPFRTKFDDILDKMHGNAAIGCISDFDPQPLLFHSHLGTYAMCMIGVINNADELMNRYLKSSNSFFNVMTGGNVNSVDLLAALINQKDSFEEGIRFAQENIDGTASILILTNEGKLIAARDYWGSLPLLVGQSEDGCCTCFESFAFEKLGYKYVRNLGPAEVVEITADGITQLLKPREEMKLCSFMWTYYGFPTSTYEDVNVELMRNRNGQIMAQNDSIAKNAEDIDSVSGVPDSGTAHAIGYANESGVPFTRPFIKYTPTWARSFTPTNQAVRNRVAKMKQIPVNDLIK
ncbi:MAG: amidophosphoribosyltransferase, partial [Clostridia bacterium]|nr:amidophosphoribosyltransferase [Clostridia bacterium]